MVCGNLKPEVVLQVEGRLTRWLALDCEARQVLRTGAIRQVEGQERLGVALISLDG